MPDALIIANACAALALRFAFAALVELAERRDRC